MNLEPYSKHNVSRKSYTGVYAYNGTDYPYEASYDATMHDEGFKNREWRADLAAARDCTTARDAYKLESFGTPLSAYGTVLSAGIYKPVSFSGFHPLWFDMSAGENTSMDASASFKAKSKLVGKVRDGTHLGGVLAELHQSLTMLRQPFSTLVSALEGHNFRVRDRLKHQRGEYRYLRQQPQTAAVRKRISVLSQSALRLASDAWLLTSFGLKPAIDDINGMSATLDNVCGPGIDRIRASGTERSSASYSNDSTGTYYIKFRRRHQFLYRTRVNYSVGLFREAIDRPHWNVGLSPEDIPLLLWEATPWSWLVDYVIPIQQTLNMWATFRNLNFVYVSKSIKRSTSVFGTFEAYGSTPKVSLTSMSPGRLFHRYSGLERSTDNLADVSLPQLSMKFNMCRGINVASVVASRLIT